MVSFDRISCRGRGLDIKEVTGEVVGKEKG